MVTGCLKEGPARGKVYQWDEEISAFPQWGQLPYKCFGRWYRQDGAESHEGGEGKEIQGRGWGNPGRGLADHRVGFCKEGGVRGHLKAFRTWRSLH